jgi:PAS domain S-box-containing protein
MSFSESVPRFFTATGFSFIAALLLSMGVAGYSLHSVREFQDAETWINDSQAATQKLEETLSTVKDLLSSSRGYALTGQPEYLDRYMTARDALPPMMATIRQDLNGNADQLRRQAALSELLTLRIAMTQQQIKREAYGQTAIFNYGQDLTDQIRAKFAEIQDVESKLVAQRSKDSKLRALRTRYAIVGGNLLSCLMLIWVFLRLRREMRKRHFAQLQVQKSARESEDLYNLAPCGYHSIDSSGTIIKMNDTGLQWFGYAREEIVGKLKSSDLMAPESRRFYLETAFPQFLRDGAISGAELRFMRKDGSSFMASVNSVAVRGPDNAFLMSRTVLNDVSALKNNESKIEALNLALHTRAAQLELANKELEGFSYSVSHDLRAPLRVIGGYAMMLEEDYAATLDEDGKRYLNVIRTNSRKMDALIVDLLKLSRSTLTPLTLAPVDMPQIVQKAIGNMESSPGNPAIAITVDHLANTSANAAMIQQVWENLLSNAAKFSRKSAQPAIHISAQRAPDETVYCIEDNGVGFDVAQAPKMFEVFQRFHSQDEFPGTGIGLALVKRIVTRHGGRVWAQSQPGAGARFYFSLPTMQPAAEPGAEHALAAGHHPEGQPQP